ncbi:MAG: pilus assembly protein [Planctomycetota bacterium]
MNYHARQNRGSRRGGILVLMTVLIPVLFVLAAFTINMSYMQLSRTELMVATDAATRAAGRGLSELQDVDLAKALAENTAAMNTVGGEPLQLDFEDSANEIEFGNATNSNSTYSRYNFSKVDTSDVRNGLEPATAVRITGICNPSSETGSVDLPFPGFGLGETFDVTAQSVAMQVDRDIAMVLDRSGSMGWINIAWEDGFTPWNTTIYEAAVTAGVLTKSFSRGRWRYYYASGQNSTTYQQWVWEDYLGNEPVLSPWESLVVAVGSFLDVLEGTVQSEKVSIASYASSASLDLNLESNYQTVRDVVDTLTPSGATAIGLGMETGSAALFNTSFGRSFAAKTLIVMTDGVHNTGISPVTAANNIVAAHNVTIHTVTFGAGADQDLMQDVAAIGGGMHYHAANSAELIEVFEEIANNLPTIVTQ